MSSSSSGFRPYLNHRPSRRRVLRAGLGAVLGLALARSAHSHTPYRQWQVYRKRHLLVVAAKSDPVGYDTARTLAAALAEHLPESRSRPSRAPSLERIASLIASKQMDVAVLTRSQAAAFAAGGEAFRGSGPVELRGLFMTATHLLVCRKDFPAAHAYLVARTLDRHRAELALPGAGIPDRAGAPVPIHEGVALYRDGKPLPGQATTGQDSEHDLEDHRHPRAQAGGVVE